MRKPCGQAATRRLLVGLLGSLTLALVGCSGESEPPSGVGVSQRTQASQAALEVIEASFELPVGITREAAVLASATTVTLADGVLVTAPSGAHVVAVGSGRSEFGADATLGSSSASVSIVSGGDLWLRERARINGNASLAGVMTRQNGTIVTGTLAQHAPLALDGPMRLDAHYRAGSAPVALEPDTARTVPEGIYGALSVKSRATLTLGEGNYFFESMMLEPGAKVVLPATDGPTVIYVRGAVTFRGSILGDDAAARFAIVATGTTDVVIDAPFAGTVVAPRARLTLSPVDGSGHVGSFFGRELSVGARNPVTHRAFAHWDWICPPQSVVQGDRELKLTGRVHEFGTAEEYEQSEAQRIARAEAGTPDPEPEYDLESLADSLRAATLVPSGHEYVEEAPDFALAEKILSENDFPESEPEEPAELTDEDLLGMSIFGDDNRQRVDRTGYPFSPHGWWAGGSLPCTVTLVGPSTAVSAAHCVHNGTRWVAVNRGEFGFVNFGGAQASCWDLSIANGYLKGDTGSNNDYVVLEFDSARCRKNGKATRPGLTQGWLGLRAAATSTLDGEDVWYLYGYPGEKGGLQLWGTSSSWNGVRSSLELKFRIDATKGQSGAGVYRKYGSSRYVIGILKGEGWDLFHGGSYNKGRRVTRSFLDWVERHSRWRRDGGDYGYPSQR